MPLLICEQILHTLAISLICLFPGELLENWCPFIHFTEIGIFWSLFLTITSFCHNYIWRTTKEPDC